MLKQEKTTGWSDTHSAYSFVKKPKEVSDIKEIIQEAKKEGLSIIPRGAGCSYGDQFLNSNNISIDLRSMDKIIDWDNKKGYVKCQPGVTIESILLKTLPDGWSLPVIPGTRYVTVGGALANNVHGKNSYKLGNFGEWVRSFNIILSDCRVLKCNQQQNKELFEAVIGGAGLIGVVTEVEIETVRVPSPYLDVKKQTAPNLHELLEVINDSKKDYDFTIGQIDCFAKGKHLGRGTMHAGRFIKNDLQTNFNEIQNIPKNIFGIFPKKILVLFGRFVLNDWTMKVVSKAKYYWDYLSSKDSETQNIFQYSFLLDSIPNWRKVFKNGFYEYEPLIPKKSALEVIPKLINLTHEYKTPVYLAAIKVHRKDNFLLSYSMDGYSLAMDIPREPGKEKIQEELFGKMNDIVKEAGGIVYLAKDAILSDDDFKIMYPNYDLFKNVKQKYDPDEIFQSDMYRRIFK